MIPAKDVRLQFGILLAADDTTLAPAVSANKIALFKNNAVIADGTVVGDLDLADFDGSAAIAGATGAQQTGLDPDTNDQLITIKDPAGGYRFITTGLTNLPQTIYGFALLSNDLATYLAGELLETPVTLTAIGQEINIGKAQMRMVAQPAS